MRKEAVAEICEGYILGTGISDTLTKMLEDIYEYCLEVKDYATEDDYESYCNRSECAHYVADMMVQALSENVRGNIWKILK